MSDEDVLQEQVTLADQADGDFWLWLAEQIAALPQEPRARVIAIRQHLLAMEETDAPDCSYWAYCEWRAYNAELQRHSEQEARRCPIRR